jgi:hypothetical protein
MSRDWVHWHAGYDADGPLARRLAIVQRHIREGLDARAGKPISVLSMCSGDGRDLLGVLSDHPAGKDDVAGRLVELDPTLSAAARRRIRDASLAGLEVVNEDAGVTTAYIGAAPADLVLACGVFGNVSDADIERTIRAMPMLCKEGATVIWTRHRRPPDLTPAICRWFREAGFENVAFEEVRDSMASVGVELFRGRPLPLVPDVRLFHFSEGGPDPCANRRSRRSSTTCTG